MAEVLDCRGMKCPQPVLKTAIKAKSMAPGSVLEVYANCPTFPDDVTKWCSQTGKVLVSIVEKDDYKIATIQF